MKTAAPPSPLWITDTIKDEAHRFKVIEDRKPDRVFLGLREHRALHALAVSFAGRPFNAEENEAARLQFDGMAVYRVDAASHISFGVSVPPPPSPCG